MESFMANDLFIDTSGLFAFLVKKEARHERVSAIIKKALKEGCRLVTTDYIIDESATLLKVRGYGHVTANLFDGILSSRACRIEWMDREAFEKTKSLFLKFNDHQWSFTDCFSFICMRRAGITDALTNDMHFREAGFTPLLD
jgi:predicted nucleic acid-binding protein